MRKLLLCIRGRFNRSGPPPPSTARPRIFTWPVCWQSAHEFVAGRVRSETGLFNCAHLTLDIANLLGRPLWRLTSGPLDRCRDREDSLQPAAGKVGFMTGELELIEDIGSDRFLHLLCDGVEIVARSGKTVEFEPGDLISLNVAATAWHFFRAGTRVDV